MWETINIIKQNLHLQRSIKIKKSTKKYLHSNMVLLLPQISLDKDRQLEVFTFQYGVTITNNNLFKVETELVFTFQYGVTITKLISYYILTN